jgi:hypothetical protein
MEGIGLLAAHLLGADFILPMENWPPRPAPIACHLPPHPLLLVGGSAVVTTSYTVGERHANFPPSSSETPVWMVLTLIAIIYTF